MAMNHSLSRGLSPSAGSYISLRNSDTSRAEAPKPGRKDVPRVALAEVSPAASLATRSQHETTPATTMAHLAIGPRSVDSHDAARPMSHRWRRS
jgi:hypothetical protein